MPENPTIPRTCQHCGKAFLVTRSKSINGRGKYCSRECKELAAVTRVDRTCQVCGTLIEVIPANVAKGFGKYCSRACRDEAQRTSILRTCPHCGESFRVIPALLAKDQGKYCSRACRAAAGHVRRTCQHCRRSFDAVASEVAMGWAKFCCRTCFHESRARVPRICRRCGTSFAIIPSKAAKGRGHFCSRTCAHLWKRDHFVGIGEFTKGIRRLVWDRDKGICHICLSFVPFGPDYHCGHIVDRVLGGSAEPENLTVMCARCNLTKPEHATREEYEAWRLDH